MEKNVPIESMASLYTVVIHQHFGDESFSALGPQT